MADDEIPLNRGSDMPFEVEFQDDAGEPMDLTGATNVEVFEPHANLSGHVSVALGPDPTLGIITGRIEWDGEFKDGRRMSFRVRCNLAGDDVSSPPIWVLVQ